MLAKHVSIRIHNYEFEHLRDSQASALKIPIACHIKMTVHRQSYEMYLCTLRVYQVGESFYADSLDKNGLQKSRSQRLLNIWNAMHKAALVKVIVIIAGYTMAQNGFTLPITRAETLTTKRSSSFWRASIAAPADLGAMEWKQDATSACTQHPIDETMLMTIKRLIILNRRRPWPQQPQLAPDKWSARSGQLVVCTELVASHLVVGHYCCLSSSLLLVMR